MLTFFLSLEYMSIDMSAFSTSREPRDAGSYSVAGFDSVLGILTSLTFTIGPSNSGKSSSVF